MNLSSSLIAGRVLIGSTHRLVRSGSIGIAMAAAFVSACSKRVPDEAPQAASSPTVITAEELAKVDATNAYDAIRKLRPSLLKSRGRTSLMRSTPESPTVYLDDRKLGDISNLNDLNPRSILEIRYLSASEAQVKFGMGLPGGVLAIKSMR
jgi:hypothetical protein